MVWIADVSSAVFLAFNIWGMASAATMSSTGMSSTKQPPMMAIQNQAGRRAG
jgi:TRAP-type C4-dicarboxylate transport system permease small subunit